MRLVDADELKAWVEEQANERWGLSTDEVWDAIDHEPSVEPKRGHWIADKYTRICSECGRSYWLRFAEPWNYCPHCGVCMKRKGGQNGRKED